MNPLDTALRITLIQDAFSVFIKDYRVAEVHGVIGLFILLYMV